MGCILETNRRFCQGGARHLIQPFPGQKTYLQLQYSQLSILIFNGVLWPHINVGTWTLSRRIFGSEHEVMVGADTAYPVTESLVATATAASGKRPSFGGGTLRVRRPSGM